MTFIQGKIFFFDVLSRDMVKIKRKVYSYQQEFTSPEMWIDSRD